MGEMLEYIEHLESSLDKRLVRICFPYCTSLIKTYRIENLSTQLESEWFQTLTP